MPISTAGRSGCSKGASASSGFTLIELLVTMAIVAVLFAVAATGLRDVFDVNLKTTARQLSSTLRYLRNKAVTERLTLRMVVDLDHQSWWVEESRDPFAVARPAEAEAPEEGETEGEGETTVEEPAEEGAAPEGEAAEWVQAMKSTFGTGAEEGKAAFTPSESRLLKERRLPSDVFFKDLLLDYLGDKREQGKVYLYFFPDGWVTGGVLHLRDEEDESQFSILVEPLSGRVKVEEGYAEAPAEAP